MTGRAVEDDPMIAIWDERVNMGSRCLHSKSLLSVHRGDTPYLTLPLVLISLKYVQVFDVHIDSENTRVLLVPYLSTHISQVGGLGGVHTCSQARDDEKDMLSVRSKWLEWLRVALELI